MDLSMFDASKLGKYAAEAKEKWGDTKAFQEFEEKAAALGLDKLGGLDGAAQKLMGLFAELGGLRQQQPGAKAVQDKIGALRDHITENYFNCTPELLRSLGQMYTGDERFRQKIDQAGGEGTAAFVKQAIDIFCSKAK